MRMQPSLEMKYFVVKPRPKFAGDPYALASRKAMLAYAKEIENINPDFAQEIIEWVNQEKALNSAMPK